MARREPWLTTPPSNLISDEQYLRWVTLFSEMHRAIGNAAREANLRLVAFHQAKLGRQSYVFQNSRRLWVWEFREDGFQIYVGNQKGICFEVPPDANESAIFKALESYRRRMEVGTGV